MTAAEIQALLGDRSAVQVSDEIAERLRVYLELLLRWNRKTNLSAIRAPEEIVTRHFGESLQCARALPSGIRTLLDYGSGAGFPGALIALCFPEIEVTLAESQSKKASFLQELARSILPNADVHGGRVDELRRTFDAVTLRAVDRMEQACLGALARLVPRGWLVVMTTRAGMGPLAEALPPLAWKPPAMLAGSEQGIVALGRKLRS